MKMLVAITAASGAIYARQLIDMLLASPRVEPVGLVLQLPMPAEVAPAGRAIGLPDDRRIVRFGNDDLFAPPASGFRPLGGDWRSAPTRWAPSGRIACGTGQTLIERGGRRDAQGAA